MPTKLLHLLDMLDSQSSLFKYGLTTEACDGQVEQEGSASSKMFRCNCWRKRMEFFIIGSPKRKGSHVIFAPGG